MLASTIHSLAISLVATLAAASAQAVGTLSMFLSNGTDTPSGITEAVWSASPVVIDIFMTPGPEGRRRIDYDLFTLAGTPVGPNNDANTGSDNRGNIIPYSGPGSGNCSTPDGSDCNLDDVSNPRFDVANGIRIFHVSSSTGFGPNDGMYRIGTARFLFSGPDMIRFQNVLAYDNSQPLSLPFSATTRNTFLITPEPSSALLLGLGLFGLKRVRRARD
jgi:hypothetical protein